MNPTVLCLRLYVAYIKCYSVSSVVSLFTFFPFFMYTFLYASFSVHSFEMHIEMSKCNEVTELQPQFS